MMRDWVFFSGCSGGRVPELTTCTIAPARQLTRGAECGSHNWESALPSFARSCIYSLNVIMRCDRRCDRRDLCRGSCTRKGRHNLARNHAMQWRTPVELAAPIEAVCIVYESLTRHMRTKMESRPSAGPRAVNAPHSNGFDVLTLLSKSLPCLLAPADSLKFLADIRVGPRRSIVPRRASQPKLSCRSYAWKDNATKHRPAGLLTILICKLCSGHCSPGQYRAARVGAGTNISTFWVCTPDEACSGPLGGSPTAPGRPTEALAPVHTQAVDLMI